MRLIAADNINFYCNYDGDCTGAIDKCKECSNYICNFKDIQEQPTAFDIDNVVEELEKREEHYVEMLDWQGQSAICDAIEIVKHGGVSDDVCELKIKDKVIYASCNNKQIASAFCWFNECGDYKYCPYCGKKIKVVE